MQIRAACKWIVVMGLFVSFILTPPLRGRGRSESDAKPAYRDLTQKEHCLKNLALSYTNQDIDRFKELLHERYVYIIRDKKTTKTRSRKYTVNAVNYMFDNSTKIRAEITHGEWEPVKTFSGEACRKCWSTNREFIMRIAGPEMKEKEFSTECRFIVAPVEEAGILKYKLRGEVCPEFGP